MSLTLGQDTMVGEVVGEPARERRPLCEVHRCRPASVLVHVMRLSRESTCGAGIGCAFWEMAAAPKVGKPMDLQNTAATADCELVSAAHWRNTQTCTNKQQQQGGGESDGAAEGPNCIALQYERPHAACGHARSGPTCGKPRPVVTTFASRSTTRLRGVHRTEAMPLGHDEMAKVAQEDSCCSEPVHVYLNPRRGKACELPKLALAIANVAELVVGDWKPSSRHTTRDVAGVKSAPPHTETRAGSTYRRVSCDTKKRCKSAGGERTCGELSPGSNQNVAFIWVTRSVPMESRGGAGQQQGFAVTAAVAAIHKVLTIPRRRHGGCRAGE